MNWRWKWNTSRQISLIRWKATRKPECSEHNFKLMKESIEHWHYGTGRSSSQAQFAWCSSLWPVKSYCTYFQNCAWKYSSWAGHFCLQRVKSHALNIRFTHTSSQLHLYLRCLQYCTAACLLLHEPTSTGWQTVLLHDPPPGRPGCQVSTTWTGTHALLKSEKEDIQWVPKHKGAPLKDCLLRQRQLLQSCYCHMSW